jgi:hypothetical protein
MVLVFGQFIGQDLYILLASLLLETFCPFLHIARLSVPGLSKGHLQLVSVI